MSMNDHGWGNKPGGGNKGGNDKTTRSRRNLAISIAG
jgi:hypothetical protein